MSEKRNPELERLELQMDAVSRESAELAEGFMNDEEFQIMALTILLEAAEKLRSEVKKRAILKAVFTPLAPQPPTETRDE